jgi:group I intron endonuclease
MIGIYKITSPSGKIYIGQSIDLEKRRLSYKRSQCKNQTKLYNSINKYGFSEHIFEVVEECFIEVLNERERHWQDFYNVLSEGGLNCRLTGTGDASGVRSQETIRKISTKRIAFDSTEEGRKLRNKQSTSLKAFFKTAQLT